MKPRTLILADDLTGALDSAVGFARPGVRVIVARNPGAVPYVLEADPDVLAINTASRELPEDRATSRVGKALSHLELSDYSVVMKKVDSRLKGNIAAETGELMRRLGARRCVASPAIPSMGRHVRNGALEGAGVAAPIPLAGCFRCAVDVPEIVTDADLDALVAEGAEGVLWIGARGLAFALARRAGLSMPEKGVLQSPLMIANGSRDPITRAQIAALPEGVNAIDAPNGGVRGVRMPDGPLVLSISDGADTVPPQEAAARFAASAVGLARDYKPGALLICGGETAQATLDRLGISSLQVIAELRPGLPLCEVRTGWGTIQIVTKSGGFGEPDLLAGIVRETMVNVWGSSS